MIVKANQQTKPNNPTTLSNETGLNEEALVTLLRNSYELQQQETQEEEDDEEEEEEEDNEEKKNQTSVVNEEIRECPMCYWEFPKHLTLENKKEHIENHFA
jgi:TATA-binding protein-associated factor Taf7